MESVAAVEIGEPVPPVRAALGSIWVAAHDLVFRIRRFVVATIAASVVLALLLLVTGVVNQFHLEPKRTTESFGAAVWVTRSGIDNPFTAATGYFGAESTDQIISDGPRGELLIGALPIDLGPRTRNSIVVGYSPGELGEPVPESGRLPRTPGEIAVSEVFRLEPGDAVSLGGFPVTVSGIVADSSILAGTGLVYLPIGVMRQAAAEGREISTVVLLTEPPSHLPPSLNALSQSEIIRAALSPMARPILTIHVIRVMLALVAALVIGAIIFLATIERTRDIAVLRAVGTPSWVIAVGVGAQALMISVVAAIGALALGLALEPLFPLGVHLNTFDIAILPVITAIVSVAASYAAIRRTLSIQPADAFVGN